MSLEIKDWSLNTEPKRPEHSKNVLPKPRSLRSPLVYAEAGIPYRTSVQRYMYLFQYEAWSILTTLALDKT